jgi:hypothetical protein
MILPSPAKISIVNLQISQRTIVGGGAVFANAYTNLPEPNRVPCCPEESTTSRIAARAQRHLYFENVCFS